MEIYSLEKQVNGILKWNMIVLFLKKVKSTHVIIQIIVKC